MTNMIIYIPGVIEMSLIERLADAAEEEMEKVKPQLDELSRQIKKLEQKKQAIWQEALENAKKRVDSKEDDGDG